ncbi:MAG: hypothetical protein P8N76_20725 [Pirellulaceae bacterium]|nr:hypothetical protein [Pirellulaceae bacterium]
MTSKLDCHAVFEILTRAPDPTGRSTDLNVQRHLALCHECRQLAESVRPATDLFTEALKEAERIRLPAFDGTAQTVMEQIRCEVASRPAAKRRSPRPISKQTEWLPAFGLVMLLLIAISCGPNIPETGKAHPLPTPLGSVADAKCLMSNLAIPSDCVSISTVGQLRIASGKTTLQPTTAHNKSPSREITAFAKCQSCHEIQTATNHQQTCCTHCHHARIQSAWPQASASELAAACSTCHL